MSGENETARAAINLYYHTDRETISSKTVQHLYVIKAEKITRRQYTFITNFNYLE